MSREQEIVKAKEMRDEGLRYREIAEQLGCSTSTAYALANPERTAPYRNGRVINPERARANDREYDQTHRGECDRCGGDRPRRTHGPLCGACVADDVDRRARQIERWWGEGSPLAEIADRLGWSTNHLGTEFVRLREKGYDLPYRYEHRRTRPRFPDQVAA